MTRTAAGERAAAAAAEHPDLVALARGAAELGRLRRFTSEIARYLAGDDAATLGPLARVVTQVARRELDDVRRLSRGQALMAVEGAVAAVRTLWPLLRGPLEAEEAAEEAGELAEANAEAGEGSEETEPAADDAGAMAPGGLGIPGGAGKSSADGGISSVGARPGGDDPMDALPRRVAGALHREFVKHDVTDMLRDAGEQAVSVALAAGELQRWLERIVPGLGWSFAVRELDVALVERLDETARLLGQLPSLEAIAARIGRLEGDHRRGKTQRGGGGPVVGVHLGGDVSQALPAELALLADEDTEDLFYARWLERRLVSLQTEGEASGGEGGGDRRGPVIACIDTSGSMAGEPELLAKAFVLALARNLQSPRGGRNRMLHVLLFSGPSQAVELRMGPGREGLAAFLTFLAHTFRSGTDYDTPLRRAAELVAERELRAADVLVVTDGLGRASARVVRDVAQLRAAHGVRVWSVLVGDGDATGVSAFSDVVWALGDRLPDLGRV
jgi:uncharacterized protein with von Willebrand factor type A (vWA) domain